MFEIIKRVFKKPMTKMEYEDLVDSLHGAMQWEEPALAGLAEDCLRYLDDTVGQQLRDLEEIKETENSLRGEL